MNLSQIIDVAVHHVRTQGIVVPNPGRFTGGRPQLCLAAAMAVGAVAVYEGKDASRETALNIVTATDGNSLIRDIFARYALGDSGPLLQRNDDIAGGVGNASPQAVCEATEYLRSLCG